MSPPPGKTENRLEEENTQPFLFRLRGSVKAWVLKHLAGQQEAE